MFFVEEQLHYSASPTYYYLSTAESPHFNAPSTWARQWGMNAGPQLFSLLQHLFRKDRKYTDIVERSFSRKVGRILFAH
jgi:hypothetical protein